MQKSKEQCAQECTCGWLTGQNGDPTKSSLQVKTHFLPDGEFVKAQVKKKSITLHHTAGWHNPMSVVDQWGRDTRGRIGTEFVIGGIDVRNGDKSVDGLVVQAFPAGSYAFHWGAGLMKEHIASTGIEVCNFGYLKDGKTYFGQAVPEEYRAKLESPFRRFREFHRYTDAQLNSLKELIIYLGKRDGIDIRAGLPEWVRANGRAAFNFRKELLTGEVNGIISHTNLRSDKTDMFPQDELLDMLLSL